MAGEKLKLQSYLDAIANAADIISVQLGIIRGWQALIESEIDDDRQVADPRADSRRDSQQPPDGGFTY